MNKGLAVLITILISILILASIALALTPLWVWLENGQSIYGGIDNTPLSFGLAFIGTFLSLGGFNINFQYDRF